MSIKVGGTVVINNSRELENLTGMEGTYTHFQPKGGQTLTSIGTSVTVFSFTNPLIRIELTQNISMTNSSGTSTPGRQQTFLIDTSTNLNDITWGSNFYFAADSEPDWTTARYWQVVCTAWATDYISVIATSWGS